MLHTSGLKPDDVRLDDYTDPDDMTLSTLFTGMKEYSHVSGNNRHIQKAIKNSAKKKNCTRTGSKKEHMH